jgi:hypothetical protein
VQLEKLNGVLKRTKGGKTKARKVEGSAGRNLYTLRNFYIRN